MAIRIKSLSTRKRQDVRYHFTDGTKLIHNSKRYYIGHKSPENEVTISGRGDNITFKYKDRGSEPDRYTWSVTVGSGKLARTTWYTGASLPRTYDRGSNSERTQWTKWDDNGTGNHIKLAVKTKEFIEKEIKAGRK